jgi:Cdc6-like AAA superfamily ATPase
MKNIKQLFIANLFDDLMNLKAKDMSKVIIHQDIDVFWTPVLGGGSVYNSDKDNNIKFSPRIYYFYIPWILNKKINRLHVTQERFDKFMTDNSLENQIKTAKETKLLSLDILLKTKTPSANPTLVLTKFLETIRANSVSLNTNCSNSVPVKYIKLKQTETTTESDNPAYKEWVKKKDLILSNLAPVSANSAPISNPVELINSSPNSSSSGVIQSSAAVYNILPSLVDSMPPEKLMITKTGFVIDEQTINQTCRQMQSLSLKSRDKKKLMHALDDYLEDGQTLKAWGIKNKLNILLYGEPGTGKSSTIEAIATYLNKPIYYVDMKEARTNNDLKLIFDHVNSVAVGGGIIVMEDIDAMTTCVHKRFSSGETSTACIASTANTSRTDILSNNTSDTNTTVSAIMADKETNTLTLEFFLNILDGVLTADKSIFITTTNHIENLDPAFYRAGRFNLKIELGACNHDQMNYIYKNMRGHEISLELLHRIPEKVFKPAEFIFHIKDYVRDPTLTDAEILEPFIAN